MIYVPVLWTNALVDFVSMDPLHIRNIHLWKFHRVPYGTIAPHMFNKQGIQTIYYTHTKFGG